MNKKGKLLNWTHSFLIVMMMFCVSIIPSNASGNFTILRQRYIDLVAGGTEYNANDPDIAYKITSITDEAQGYWNSLNKSSSRNFLWSDAADGSQVNSHVLTNYSRLRSMAIAYQTYGSPLYHDENLLTDIADAVNWLNQHWYSTTKPAQTFGNSWTWSIGVPLRLSMIIALTYDGFSSNELSAQVAGIDRFSVDIGSNNFAHWTGANRSDLLKAKLICGIVTEDNEKMLKVRDQMSPLFSYVTSGDGFYLDGSHIMHGNVAYTGTYGNVLLSGVADLLYLLNDSSWEIFDPQKDNVYEWIYDSYQPIMYKGAAMDMVRGRAIARESQPDHVTGDEIVAALAKLSMGAPSPHKENFQRMIKLWVGQEEVTNVYDAASLYSTSIIKGIMNDNSITPTETLIGHYEMSNMGRTIHHTQNYAFGISRSSKRVANYELTNGENGRGWTTGDGMTYLYNNDVAQFAEDFWPTVNALRLPGTTVEVRSRYFSHNQWGDSEGAPTNNWSGGTYIGNFGIAGMNLIPRNGATTGSLNAYKSWFMFDDEIVALGSNISASSDYRVESIIENRKLKGDASNKLTINGAIQPSTAGWENNNIENAQWAHLEGNIPGSDIGYYFPTKPTISALRQTRTKTWSNINSGGSTDPRTKTYMTMYFNHGVNPDKASYSYVLLPNKSTSEVETYASQPHIKVIENSTSAHAVKESTLGITGVNFWDNKTYTTAGITSNKKASVMMNENPNNTVEVAVSDPTFENNGDITIEINQPALDILSKNSNITVHQTTPTLRFSVNVNNAHGKTFNLIFKSTATNTLTAIEDTFVWDGEPDNNYGSYYDMKVKTSPVGYNRDILLKFDVANTSIVQSAKIRLYGSSNITALSTIGAYKISSDWNENSVTWSSAPAPIAYINSFKINDIKKYYEVDVTEYVNEFLQNSSSDNISFRLKGLDNQSAYCSFRTRQVHPDEGTQPQLVIYK